MTRTARTDDQGQRDPAPARQPAWLEPELATLTGDRFSDPAWIFERKLDGERCLAFRDGEQLRLMTRNQQEVTSTYPEIAEALAGPASRATSSWTARSSPSTSDQTSFARLQQRLGVRDPAPDLLAEVPVYYLPVRRAVGRRPRRAPAAAAGAQGSCCATCCPSPTRCASPSTGTPTARRTTARRAARAGRGSSPSAPTRPTGAGRTKDWLKFKCENGQEFVIGGFTDPQGSRIGFGALLLGYYDPDGQLRLRGQGRHRLQPADAAQPARRRLAALERPQPALRARPRPAPSPGCTGSSPSLSPRSASASGPRTGSCATRGSRGCAGTRTPPKSCGKCHEVTVVMRVLD